MKLSCLVILILLVLHAGSVAAATIHYWRFEDSPGFLADSAGLANLTASASAQQATLPATGRGSSFRLLDFGNAKAADLPQTDVLTASTSLAGNFTIELFAHADSVGSNYGDTLAGFGLGRFNNQIGWLFQIRSNFVLTASEGNTASIIDSGIHGAPGKDYYAAVAFDLAGDQATFYVQNLTDGGPLQVATVTHSLTTYNAISTFSIGAAANGEMGFDGLIDEVLLSDTVLSQEQLLVNHFIPEPGTLSLLALGGLAVMRRKKK
ncbi:MAG: LamG-like jellyroll fold domain-containing protein [Planctomycetota bacterium]|jgi:hypothetical protein